MSYHIDKSRPKINNFSIIISNNCNLAHSKTNPATTHIQALTEPFWGCNEKRVSQRPTRNIRVSKLTVYIRISIYVSIVASTLNTVPAQLVTHLQSLTAPHIAKPSNLFPSVHFSMLNDF